MKIVYQKKEIDSKLLPTFKELCKTPTIFLFYGQVGAGKTTLIRELCKSLFEIKDANSPTFAYVKKYDLTNSNYLSHFDLYRLKSKEDFLTLGLEEDLFDPKTFCFIEWPEVIESTMQYLELSKPIYTVKINHLARGRELLLEPFKSFILNK